MRMKAINLLLVCFTFYLRTAAQKTDSTLSAVKTKYLQAPSLDSGESRFSP
jgi:hypothetical protein